MDARGIFICLQLLDIFTTISFLSSGIQEANPLIKWFMDNFGTAGGLLLSKSLGFIFFIVAISMKKERVVVKANYFYVLLVSWNLFCIYR